MEPSFTKLALLVEYEGTRYLGFQVQRDQPTIQGEIEEALRRLTGEWIRIVGASRTDSGAHALGQVVSFRTASQLPPETFIRGLNHYLPEDISVRAAAQVSEAFDARRHALSRHYGYTILNRAVRSPLWLGKAYQVSAPLDVEAMARASQALIGKHDFAPFTSVKAPRRTVRTVGWAEVARRGKLVTLDIEADAFLPQQVRRTVGALVVVGLGKRPVEWFRGLVESKERGVAIPTAPAHGLCLMGVNYTEGTIMWRTLGEDL